MTSDPSLQAEGALGPITGESDARLFLFDAGFPVDLVSLPSKLYK